MCNPVVSAEPSDLLQAQDGSLAYLYRLPPAYENHLSHPQTGSEYPSVTIRKDMDPSYQYHRVSSLMNQPVPVLNPV
jgi:hypothetical protein